VSRRGGTRFVDDIGECRLIPFTFNQDESYVVAITVENIYVYNTSRPHFRVLINLNALPVLDLAFNVVFQGYLTVENIKQIQYSQIGDILYLVHPSFRPMAIVRQSVANFQINTWDNLPRPLSGFGSQSYTGWAYLPQNTTAMTMTLDSLVLGTRTLTASAAYFNPDMVGSWIKLAFGGTDGYFYIAAYTNSTVVTGALVTAPGSVGPATTWYASAWSDYFGWPRTVIYSDARLIFGGNSFQPDTMWFSHFQNTRVHEQATSGVTLLSSYSASIASSAQVNQIQWMSKGKTLQLGTLGGEYIVEPPDPALIMGAPDNLPNFQADTNYGSEYVQPIRYESSIAFIQRGGLKIMELVFDFNEDSYKADNITILADHVIKQRFETEGFEFANQKFTNLQYTGSSDIIWAIDDSYGLFGITRDRNNDVVAWHTHDIAGMNPSSDPENPFTARVKSICAAPGEGDELWVVVNREINGVDKHYIEVIVDEYIGTDLEDPTKNSQRKTPHFSDSSLSIFNGQDITVNSANVNTGTETLTITKVTYSDVSNITDGIMVTYGATATPIGGLTPGNDYYIVNSSVTFDYGFSTLTIGTMQLSATPGGSAIGLTSTGTGDHVFTIAATSTIFGRFDHLEGETVSVIADGSWVGTKVVTDGQIELAFAAGDVVVGLNYNTDIELLPVEAGGIYGTAQGAVKRIDEVIFRFYRTIGGRYGRQSSSLDKLIFRPSMLPMNEAIPMYTGDKVSEMLGDWDRQGTLYIRQDIPLPFTLCAVILRGVTNDS